MNIQDFIKKNRTALDKCIKAMCPNVQLNDAERLAWIENDEGLYLWAKSEGVKI